MGYDTYQLESKDSMITFEFISEGPNGSIKKRVHYQKMISRKTYNLALGDVNEETGGFDTKVISNNKDTEKVLATVVATIYAFTNENPDARIYIEGNSIGRNRLYRMGISNNFEELSKEFNIYGFLEDLTLVVYEKNKSYSAFLIVKK
jgi:hypothetical protein